MFYDYHNFEATDINADRSKKFTFDELKQNMRDNLNFRPVNTIGEDAKGVWYRDYMWFQSDEDFTMEKAAGADKDWPEGRALIFNGRRNFLVHINDLDHIKTTFITHQGDLLENYKKLQLFFSCLKTHPLIPDFSKHRNFGYVNTRVADLGCGLVASMIL